MKKYSIMDTQHNLAKVLREVEAGYTVQITRRKKVVARLSPPAQKKQVIFPDFKARARNTWQGKWRGHSTEQLLDESRGDQ